MYPDRVEVIHVACDPFVLLNWLSTAERYRVGLYLLNTFCLYSHLWNTMWPGVSHMNKNNAVHSKQTSMTTMYTSNLLLYTANHVHTAAPQSSFRNPLQCKATTDKQNLHSTIIVDRIIFYWNDMHMPTSLVNHLVVCSYTTFISSLRQRQNVKPLVVFTFMTVMRRLKAVWFVHTHWNHHLFTCATKEACI